VQQCRPPAHTLSRPLSIIGWVLRTVLVFFGGYALMLFLADAAGLLILEGYIPEGTLQISRTALLLTCAAAALFGGLLAFSRITAAGALVIAAGGGIWFAAANASRIIPFAENAARCLYNTVLSNMAEVGYTVMLGYLTDASYSFSRTRLLTWAFCTIAAVLTLLLSLCVMRRVHPIPLTLICTVVLVPVFMYNITRTNDGVMLVIAFVTGVLAMWLYDRRFGIAAERREARRARRNARREAKRSARFAAAAHKKALKLAVSDAMIAAYDAGGSRRDAAQAKKEICRREKMRQAAEKKRTESSAPAPAEADAASRREARTARRQEDRAKRRIRSRNIAAGGFAGAGALLCALAALAIPNALVEEKFPIVDWLDERVRIARLYATAYLMGDDLDLNSLSMYGGVAELNPRTLDFSSPRFSGERIFSVEAGYNAPIYLRSWIGTDYDMESDTWSSADYGEVQDFRSTFGKDFSPDVIGYNFRRYLFPTSVSLTRADMYRGYSSYGFVVTQTHVRRVGGTGRILFTPTYLIPSSGIMEYGSIEPNRYAVSSYFDGVYSSRFFAIPGRGYSTYSFITTMKDPSLGDNYTMQQAYYLLARKYADLADQAEKLHEKGTAAMITPDGALIHTDNLTLAYTELNALLEAELTGMGFERRGDSILTQYADMDAAGRAEFRASYELEARYRAYAYETYAGSMGSERIAVLAADLLRQAGWRYDPDADCPAAAQSGMKGDKADHIVDADGNPVTRHDLVRMVLDYLREDGFAYTLTPAASSGTLDSTLDAFLFEVREGYCVHFATAAAAILREYGLAVRYAEGYVASNFQQNGYGSDADYRTSIYDFNAHAWIEVYYPCMGWMQYEATPTYMSAMYDADESFSTTVVNPGVQEEEEEPEEETEDILFEEVRDYTALIVLSVLIALVLAAALTLYILLRRGRNAYEKRRALIAAARDEAAYHSAERDNRALTRSLNDAILAVFARLGCPPESGEQASAYAARIEAEYGRLSRFGMEEILPLIEKEEFGYGLSFAELVKLADYLEEMSETVYRGLSLPQRFRMRALLRVL